MQELTLKELVQTLDKSIREFKKTSILTTLLVTGEVIIECIIPFYTAELIDQINAGATTAAVLHYGLVLVALALLSLACGAAAGYTCSVASTGFARNLRHDMFENIQTFSFSNIDRFSTSSLVTRLTTDTNNVQQAYMMLIRTAIRAPMMIVFAVIMAYVTGGSMATIYVIVAVILGFFLFYIAIKVMPSSGASSRSTTRSTTPSRRTSPASAS